MLSRIKEKYLVRFKQMPTDVKMLVLLTISVFLPFYITVCVVIAAFIYILSSKSRRKVLINIPHIYPLALLVICLLVVPLCYKNFDGFFCGILFIMFIGLEIYISQFMSRKLFDLVCDICCGMSLVCIVASILQKIFQLQQRVEGLTYNSNFYAYIIELLILICFYRIATSKKPLIYVFITVANLIILCYTQCRSAWGAMIAGLFVLFILLKKRKYIWGLVAILVAMVIALYFNPSLLPRYYNLKPTAQNRFEIWQRAFADFLSHPLFGRGLLAFYQVSGNVITPHAHNILLDILECTGIVGTAIILFYFVIIVRQLIVSFKSHISGFRASAALCCAIIVATLVHGITDMPIMGVNTGLFFFLLLAFRPNVSSGFEIGQQNKVVSYTYILRFLRVLKKNNQK